MGIYKEWANQSYVSEFISLKCSGDVLNVVSPLGSKASKEITESMAVLKKLRGITLHNPMHHTLYDICAGNALTAVTAVHLFPVKEAIAIDKRPRKRKWHLAKRFSYINENVYDIKPDFFEEDAIIIAIHACTDLANRIIDLYLDSKASHLILMPCCEGVKTMYFPEIFKERLGTYLLWAYQLTLRCKGRMTVDEKILSPKNAVIVASK